jgi:hypothetical protein
VDEKREFQQHLLQHMRQALGEDVREEETLAGGRLDLRYRRIVIELKVEDAIKDREALRRKYVAQPARWCLTGIENPVSLWYPTSWRICFAAAPRSPTEAPPCKRICLDSAVRTRCAPTTACGGRAT